MSRELYHMTIIMFILQINTLSCVGIPGGWGPLLGGPLNDIPQRLWDTMTTVRKESFSPSQPIPMALSSNLLLTSGHCWLLKVALTQIIVALCILLVSIVLGIIVSHPITF